MSESFSAASAVVLRRAGWTPNRRVDSTRWLDFLKQQGYPVFDALERLLDHVGGLTLDLTPLQTAPFSIDGLKVFFESRSNPVFHFIPEQAPYCGTVGSTAWMQVGYVHQNGLALAPVGSYWPWFSAYPSTLFVLSDGTIMSGKLLDISKEEQTPALTWLGSTIVDAINRTLERSLIYWAG